MKKKNSNSMDDALLLLEEKFSNAFNKSYDMMNIIDFKDGRFVDINDSYIRISGYSREQLLGHMATELNLIYPEQLEKTKQILVRGSQSIQEKVCFCVKSGDRHIGLSTSSLIDVGGDKLIFSVIRDITDQERIEGELRNILKHYSIIINNTESIILEFDFNGNVVFANSKAKILKQEDSIKIVGCSIGELFPEKFAEEIRVKLKNMLKNCISQQYETVLMIDGIRRDVLILLVPLFTDEGKLKTVLAIIRDISDLNAAMQLRFENLALNEMNRLKNEFVANMSHDLRTPLNAILGYTELLQDQLSEKINERQLNQFEAIYKSGKSLLTLIDDILDLSRIEAGKVKLNLELLSVADIVEEVRVSILPIVNEKFQQLDVYIEPGLMVWADEVRLKQCLNNLFSNAVKYTPSGGRIRLKSAMSQGMVEFLVEDTGVGIPEDKLNAIFQPFYRIDTKTSIDTPGSGLGLAITKKLVDIMDGRVWAESKFGQGSIFHIILPFQPQTKISVV